MTIGQCHTSHHAAKSDVKIRASFHPLSLTAAPWKPTKLGVLMAVAVPLVAVAVVELGPNPASMTPPRPSLVWLAAVSGPPR